MNSEELFNKAHELAVEWVELEPEQIEPSWGYKIEFETSDPLKEVKTTDQKVILRDFSPDTDRWFIDLVRGFIHYYLPSNLQDKVSIWRFITVVALILTPTSVISESKKITYCKIWKEKNQHHVKGFHHFNYLTLYRRLAEFSRPAVLKLLNRFLFDYFQESKDLADQLSNFLINQLRSEYSELDHQVLGTVLKFQTLDASELVELLELSDRNQIYPSLSRLNFHIGSYFITSREYTKLDRMILPDLNEAQFEKLVHIKFFENRIHFVDKDDTLIYFWFPRNYFPNLLEKFAKNSKNTSFTWYHQLPQNSQVRASPGMYNVDDKKWESVKERSVSTYELIPEMNVTEGIESIQELEVMQQIIERNTDDYRKISINTSQSTTKKVVRKLQKKGAYIPVILWRRPVELVTKSYIIQISDLFNLNDIDCNLEEIYQQLEKSDYNETLDKITKLSWPYLAIQHCAKVIIESQNVYISKVAIIELAAIEEDHKFILEFEHVELIGENQFTQGSSPRLPVEQFNKTWILDLENFTTIIEKKEA